MNGIWALTLHFELFNNTNQISLFESDFKVLWNVKFFRLKCICEAYFCMACLHIITSLSMRLYLSFTPSGMFFEVFNLFSLKRLCINFYPMPGNCPRKGFGLVSLFTNRKTIFKNVLKRLCCYRAA